VERHVRLLGILATLWGALAALVGVSMLLLAGGAFALTIDPENDAVSLASGVFAAVLLSIGLFSLVWSAAHVRAGVLLRRFAASGRILALALGVVNLLVFPFGTALGLYAFWVLLTHDGRRLFEPGHRPSSEATIR
jgi:hypothetical protein